MPAWSVRIERKRDDAAAAAEVLRRCLEVGDARAVTPADAAVRSGLPLGLCQEALFHLAVSQHGRIQVLASGELRFSFDDLRRRGTERRDAWRARAAELATLGTWALAPALFGTLAGNQAAVLVAFATAERGELGPTAAAWLGIIGSVLVVPAIILGIAAAGVAVWTMALFWALPLAALALLGGGVRALWWVAVAASEPWPRLGWGLIGLAGLSAGLALASWTSRVLRRWMAAQGGSEVLELWRAIGRFPFAPLMPSADPLEDERRLTAFIVRRGGIVTSVEVAALFGWNAAEAETQIIRVLLDYGGDIEVDDAGGVFYRFDSLGEAGQAPAAEVDTRPCWEREREPPRFLEPIQATLALIGLTALVYGAAGLSLHPRLVLFPTAETAAALTIGERLLQGFGAWAYVLPLALTAIRWACWQTALRRHAASRRLHALLQAALEAPAGSRVVAPDMRHLVALGGEIVPEEVPSDPAPLLRFPRSAADAAAAERARRSPRPPRRDASRVVFDTKEETMVDLERRSAPGPA